MAVFFATLRARRDVRWLAVGILAMALGGLTSWFAFSTVSETHHVIKLVRTVYRGQPIEASDLTVVAINAQADVPTVPAAHLNQVVGLNARTDLPAGSLLSHESYGAAKLPSGTTRVGVKLEPGRLPTSPIRSGAVVLVVAIPSSQAAQSAGMAPSVSATVQQPPEKTPDGGWLVDLNVPVANAEQVSRLAALKQVAIVVTAEG